MRPLQAVAAQGMLLDGYEMQPARIAAIGLESPPGLQEVESQAESGLDDGEVAAPAPSRRQVIALNEDMAGLRRSAIGRMVDIAKHIRVRYSLPIKDQLGFG